MTDTVVIPVDALWGDVTVALNHNTAEIDTALDAKLASANMLVVSSVAAGTGPVTLNTPTGRVTFVTGGTTLVVTNSLVTADSNVFCVVIGTDTAAVRNVIPSAGSFNILLTAGASADLTVAFMVINPVV